MRRAVPGGGGAGRQKRAERTQGRQRRGDELRDVHGGGALQCKGHEEPELLRRESQLCGELDDRIELCLREVRRRRGNGSAENDLSASVLTGATERRGPRLPHVRPIYHIYDLYRKFPQQHIYFDQRYHHCQTTSSFSLPTTTLDAPLHAASSPDTWAAEGRHEARAVASHCALVVCKYRGRWHLNPTTGQYEGNPVESAEVKDTMRSIKNKCGADGSDRVHSLAMSKEYMEKMFAWSDSICAPATYFNPLPSPAESLERMKHLMFKAFVSTGWTVWTRNFELIKLREKDLSFGFEDPRAFNTPRCLSRKDARRSHPNVWGIWYSNTPVQHLPGHYSDLKHSASESDDSNFESVGPPTSETPTKPEAPPKIKLVEEVNYVLTAMASVGLLDVFFFRGHWIGRKAPGGRRVAGL
ncbi:hypothetical protein GGX14DRAFT_660879 [Mycena pura]|uniref:Uncharacterized protein n=1 Tax=Mycena pura TaxID=153505 RepID=A0AAD6V520_9AGAR|nr:hypothetical protein GGX14DRAFT_660879 [Mycena pura]